MIGEEATDVLVYGLEEHVGAKTRRGSRLVFH